MMAFAKSVVVSLLVSSDAFYILLMIPDGPVTLPFFMFSTAARTASTDGRLFSDQGKSAVRKIFIMTLPCLSFLEPL